MGKALGLLWVLALAAISPALGADLSAERVRQILAAATPEKPADLSGKNLENLDLSKVDFKRANLSRTNLFGAKLVDANLSGANLTGAKLDLAWIMRANFTNADLSNASLLGLVVSSGLDYFPRRGADLSGRQFLGSAHYRPTQPVRSPRGGFRRRQDGRRHDKSVDGADAGRSFRRQSGRSQFYWGRSQPRADALCQPDRGQVEWGQLVRGGSLGRGPDRRRSDWRRRDRSRFRRRGSDECSRPRHR